MANGNGSVVTKIDNNGEYAKEFRQRFVKFKADDTTDVLVDTQTGVQYLMVKPTAYDQTNTTITVIPLIDTSGFPLVDERFVNKSE